ncbi:unnamed protein product [Brassicogethes aeneus]|uniref:Lipid storage droplets surface-binding protein 1 n=1 Tax=Brassicogethes aeneus TaxID=1431903 RepID=A0A9P0BDD5_BRAAE|nr:unnamed protein product [Brassicogethes aeneus]
MTHRRRRRWNKSNSKTVYNMYKTPGMNSIKTEEKQISIPVVKVSSYCQTETEMVQVKKKPFLIQDLESVNRITNFPIVETGWHYAENIYNKIKQSNNLIYWTLGQAEQSLLTVVDTAQPAIVLFSGPISTIDKIVCRSLDLVEDKVPSINLPPQMIYWNTKQYVSNVGTQIVRPVLKRADSMKQIGNTVLASKYTAFAADTLDGALNVADKYVDKYLPADDDQMNDVGKLAEGPTGKAINTMHHVDRFSRKLKRRLTQRTLAEVKALKEHSAEAVHVLIYVAELIATDPKLAFQKGKELWLSLSKDEPENQARPDNLEQLIVMLSRESARRMVHLINFTSHLVTKLPKQLSNTILHLANKVITLTDSMVKDQVAESTEKAEQLKAGLSVPQIKVQLKAAQHRNSVNKNTNAVKPTNGVENNSN